MTEREFLQQLFLLRQDIESTPMRDLFAAQQRDRWAARLGDLISRRGAHDEAWQTGDRARPAPAP